MEPLSIAIITGTAGGIAGAFTKEVWDLGKKWISSYHIVIDVASCAERLSPHAKRQKSCDRVGQCL